MTQTKLSHVILAISVPSVLLALSGCAMKAPAETAQELEVSAPGEPEVVTVVEEQPAAEEAQRAPAPDPLPAVLALDDALAVRPDRALEADVGTGGLAQREALNLSAAQPLASGRAAAVERRPAAEPAKKAQSKDESGGAVAAKERRAPPPAPTAPPPPPALPSGAAVSSVSSAPQGQVLSFPQGQAPVAGVLGQPGAGGPALQTAELPRGGAPLVEPLSASREEYTDHGVNPYTLATNDRHSTFSIDVDTASYTVARRKLQEGSLPPESAVRVEEFVNYFNYDSYAQPTDGPFSVNMEAMPDPFRPGHHTLRVGVQGKELSRGERPPLHVTFLVDVSGSMQSADKLPLAKRSMHMMVDGLNEGDTVALATYAGQVARILEPTEAVNKRKIHEAIDRLGAGGSTAMSAGIDLAYGMAMETFRKGHENRVVVLSDGDANVGNSSFDALLGQIKRYADQGVTLSTIGLGMGNYRDTLMEQLANKGDGNNFYIDGEAQAQRVFVEELGGSMVTIARDVKIQVEFNPAAVAAYRLVGYENRDIADKDFRNDRVDAGEVGSGHDVTAIYDVILKDGYAAELATVRMRYEAPGADKAAEEKAWRLHTSALKAADSLAHKDTRIAYAAATFAEVLRGSPTAAEISLDALIRYAQAAARPGQKDDQELISLMKRAQQLGAGERGQALSRR